MSEQWTDQPSKYEDRYVAYLDILGFAELTRRSASSSDEYSRLFDILDSSRRQEWYAAIYRAVEDGEVEKSRSASSDYRNWHHASDIRSISFSDTIVISARAINHGLEMLCHLVNRFIKEQLIAGVLVRGSIVWGKLTHTESNIFGPAVVKAYKMESLRARFPRVIIDEPVREHLLEGTLNLDGIAGPPIRRDFDGEYHIDALTGMMEVVEDEVLAGVASDIDSYPRPNWEEKEELVYRNLRTTLHGLREKEQSNPSILQKVEWYIHYFNETVERRGFDIEPISHRDL